MRFLTPCVPCLADEEYDRIYYQTLYGKSKEEHEAEMRKIHERIEKQKQKRREEERHQEQMRKLQDIEDELYRMIATGMY